MFTVHSGEVAPGAASDVLRRERDAFDAQAAARSAAALPPREFEEGVSFYEDTILETLGEIAGQRVLDLCCGPGDLTLRLLSRGAIVTAVDLSPGMVDLARERAAIHLGEAEGGAEFVVASAEETGLASESFDWVVGKFAVHHLDLDRVAAEISRLLKPGGQAVFVETSALSPPLSFARRRLVGRFGIPRAGTEDEHPLDRYDIATLGAQFSDCSYDFPDFVFFRLPARHLLELKPLGPAGRRIDAWIERRLPWAGRWSYAMRVQLRR